MNDWELYKARLKVNGNTTRERWANITKDNIIAQKSDLLACHKVILNGTTIDMIINRGDISSIKKFDIVDNVPIDYGDYIIWDNKYWLVTERDYDDEIHIYGKITQCNYNLKWQNASGNIITRWGIVNMVSKYNNGVYEGKVIDVLESTISITLPYDSETVLLKRDKKFIMDFVDEDPYVYIVSQRDVLSGHFGDRGLINLALSQTTSNSAADDMDTMIVDYNEDITSDCQITGMQILRLGQTNTYETTNINPAWSITAEPGEDITEIAEIVNITNPKIKIKAKSATGNINKKVFLSDGNSEFIISIKGLY